MHLRRSWKLIAFTLAWLAAIAAHDLDTHASAIVFVSREPLGGGELGQIPGLGPHGRLAGAGGRLLLRDPARDTLLELERGFDVADPDVSPDARRVAYACREHALARWRVCLRALDARDSSARSWIPAPVGADDTDPVWLDDSTLVFVRSTPGDTSLYDGSPAGNLWGWRVGAPAATRLTHERNGVLDPCVDVRTGRLLFARWWFNPWVPDGAGGVARKARTAAADSVNLWQLMSARPAWVNDTLRLVDLRLAAGGTPERRRSMGLQPTVLADGSVVATVARNTGLAPRPGPIGVQRFAPRFTPAQWLAGAAIGEGADVYAEGANLAAPDACAPAMLPGGDVLIAWNRGARGDFGVWQLHANGNPPARLVDLEGSLELDPAPIVRRRAVRIRRQHAPSATTFRYENRDVFAGAGAAPRTAGAKLIVYREGEPIRTAPIERSGRVVVPDLPADTPLFEMLVDSNGTALISAHGPTVVRGFNAGSGLQASRCVGCHLGHSIRR